MSVVIHKLMEFKFHETEERVEASTELHWYAQNGYYKINVAGFGVTEAEAIKSASLLLGQARAALHVATLNRVPETTERPAG